MSLRLIYNLINFVKLHKLVFLGLFINFSFYVSAIFTHWYDYFFFGSSIHYCCQGLDFYQIPNGLYAFLHGGNLTGKLPYGMIPYSQDIFSNFNVYHPLTTILLGGVFLLIEPSSAFYVWMIMKFLITLFLVFYIYKEFKTNKYRDLAIFFILINFSQYNEIKISQYQFLFNVLLAFLLIYLIRSPNKYKTGFLYFLTLIAKPIGILWAPVFLLKKQAKVAFIGLILYLTFTGVFYLTRVGNYFTDNLITHFLHPIPTNTIDIMSLDALLRYTFNLSISFTGKIRFIVFFLIFILSLNKKVHILKIIFLLTVSFLFFYDLIYQYHFSVLGPLLSICLLALKEFQNKLVISLIFLINLPTVFFITRAFKLGFYVDPFLGPNPTFQGWQIVSFFQILLISLLVVVVLIPDLKYYLLRLVNYVSR